MWIRGATEEWTLQQLDDAFLSRRPPIPALNRWNKLHPPLIWWLAALTLLGGVVARAVLRTSSEWRQGADPEKTEQLETAAAGTSPTSEADERRQRAARYKKLETFLTTPSTTVFLACQAIVCKPALELMGHFFTSIANGENTITPFLHPSTSPAWAAIRRLVGLLGSGDDHWAPVRGSAWTSETLGLAATLCFSMIGNLFMRCVVPFMEWPWLCGHLLSPAVTDEDKATLQDWMWGLSSCCVSQTDGFTLEFVRSCETKDAIMLDSNLQFLRDAFRLTPCCTVDLEDNFARMRVALRSELASVLRDDA